MHYEVIVVGAGHAGCEAALAAARLGANTLLLTISPDTLGAMSCNPAIGGPAAKSHLVRELDALGGEMGKVIDCTYLNIRTLNETRGPAVTALRAQADKRFYQSELTLRVERQVNLTLKQGLVTEILHENRRVIGVKLKSGRQYLAKTVILATGTFLGGQIVMGDIKYSGGRQGEPAAVELSDSLRRIGLRLRRFQTATPPRISRRSLDFAKLQAQSLQEPEWGFSWNGLPKRRPQLPCWMTTTTRKTIETITRNLNYSPIRNGMVTGKGPRFCPSIDRKVVKFPDKWEHLIFIEPEGIYTEEMYLLGLTTAMPEAVQEQILATIPGLEQAEIIRPGYAVEYDCLESFQFDASLQSKCLANLYTAGQINGTSGYEEAAVQGIVAGINAVRNIKGMSPLILSRTDSYIGVLIDDLVTVGTDEPYRMMTSLAEFRIFFRLDNALARLGEIGRQVGLVDEADWVGRRNLLDAAQELKAFYDRTKLGSESPLWKKITSGGVHRSYRLGELILRPELTEEMLREEFPHILDYPLPIRQMVWNEMKLAGYLQRQVKQREDYKILEKMTIPANYDFNHVSGLTTAALEVLKMVQPGSVGQVFRINGLTDNDRTLIWLHFKAVFPRKGEVGQYGLSG